MVIDSIRDLPPLISWKHVLQVTGFSQKTVLKMIENGSFPRWIDTGTRSRRWHRQVLAPYLPEPTCESEDLREMVRQEVALALEPFMMALRKMVDEVPIQDEGKWWSEDE